MSEKGWVGWITENRTAASGIAVALVLALVGIGVVAARSGKSSNDDQTVQAGSSTTLGNAPGLGATTGTPGETTPGGTTGGGTTGGTGGTSGGGATGGGTTGGGTTGGTGGTSGGGTSGGTTGGTGGCTPKDVKETGISKTEVKIGQIVSDVSALPAQLKPNYYGLQAYVNAINAAGGVCGRKITVVYSNDGANPATHDYTSMTHQVFSFVANSSLIDSTDYQSDAPFNPNTKDNGEYVPDIGGLAYSYGRNQSPWFAGTLGSLSPSLTGGGQYSYLIGQAKAGGKPCRKAGVLYLREPTGASDDQAHLGGIAMAEPWGGNLGTANVKYYTNNLADPVPVYEQTVASMVADGVNSAFTFSDLGSDINLVKAMSNQGVWPPTSCKRGPQCFSVVYVPFAAYDPGFTNNAGAAGVGVQSFLPHIPLNEQSSPAMQAYVKALKTVPGATPSTFSMIGYLSGQMFVTALRACGAAPTRACVMDYWRNAKGFDGGGLQGAVTPFAATRVNCSGGCGSFGGHGTYNFKQLTPCSINVQVVKASRPGTLDDWHRVRPPQGYFCDQIHVARGKPA